MASCPFTALTKGVCGGSVREGQGRENVRGRPCWRGCRRTHVRGAGEGACGKGGARRNARRGRAGRLGCGQLPALLRNWRPSKRPAAGDHRLRTVADHKAASVPVAPPAPGCAAAAPPPRSWGNRTCPRHARATQSQTLACSPRQARASILFPLRKERGRGHKGSRGWHAGCRPNPREKQLRTRPGASLAVSPSVSMNPVSARYLPPPLA
eukprot:gene21599-biopygen23643